MHAVRRAPPPTRSGTRRTRPTSGAPRSTPAATPRSCKAAYPTIKQADPGAKVLLGPLTGNNYNFLGQVYAAGAGASFDAVAVHTDTACLVDPPSSFYREDGKVARFTFLGFRTVHDVMVANGDAAKPIWMTELGWTTTTLDLRARHVGRARSPRASPRPRRPPTSRRPTTAWPPTPTSRLGCGSRSRTPPATATSSTTTASSAPTARTSPRGTPSTRSPRRATSSAAPCGDFDPPALTISAPATSEQYVQVLTISAVATDASTVARITFQADGKEIRNFTGADVGSGKAVKLEWQGAKNLAFGPHTITVIALDPQGNTVTKSVQVTRVKKLAATLKTRSSSARSSSARAARRRSRAACVKTASAGPVGQGPRLLAAEAQGQVEDDPRRPEAGQQALHLQAEAQGQGHLARAGPYLNVAPYKASTAPRRRPCASSADRRPAASLPAVSSRRSLVVVGAGVFGASLAPPLRAGRLGRRARRARRPRARARRLGRRVAHHPLLPRRRRLAHALGAARLGAVARDRPGARRRLRAWRGSRAATTAGRPRARPSCAPRGSRASASTRPSCSRASRVDDVRFTLFEPEAGILRARDAVKALAAQAVAAGAELVLAEARPDGAAVVLDDGRRLEADRVVWACGAWLRAALPGRARPAHHPPGRLLLRRRPSPGARPASPAGSTTTARPTASATSTGAA